jgi:RNA polymerase sigma-70 factor (ECF subfamily)
MRDVPGTFVACAHPMGMTGKAAMTPTAAQRQSIDPAKLADPELAALAATGHAAAFRLIMERNNGRLYRVARAVLKNDGEAEDAVQEAYVRAFTRLAGFRGRSSLSTWLTRIVLNEALGRLRRRRPTTELSEIAELSRDSAEVIRFPGAEVESDPESAAARRQIAGLLERAIDALPDPFRLVFVLRTIEDLSVEETAAELGIPEATVKTRLHRAKRMLQKSLQAELGSALADAFPFAGSRCARMTEAVLARLGLSDAPP